MEDKIYQWKRFWCPLDKEYKLSKDGYLEDIDRNYGIMNPDILSFEMMAGIPCLILLGEPGIGKTTSIEVEKKHFEKIKKENEKILFFDLGTCPDTYILYRNLFDSEEFLSWKENDNEILYLFLDSLDKCYIKGIGSLLTRELKNLPLKRLYIRIVCCITDWQLCLEKELKKLWNEDSIKLYKLTPLRHCDVKLAADVELATQDNNLDSNKFLKEIEEKEISSLAIYPVTLDFLIKEFLNKKELSNNKTDLFYRGCLELCKKEPNLRPQEREFTVSLTCEQRLAVASRIAFITIFTNKNKIYRNEFTTNNSKECIKHNEVYGYIPEKINNQEVEINKNSIEETLSIGLFKDLIDTEFLIWKNKSHQEFLAAWYLFNHQNNLEIPQIFNIVKHPEGKIIPQLYETVAWFASMNPEFFRKILEIEPEILLLGDLAKVTEEDRRDLVSELLNLFDCGKIIKQVDLNLYRKLKNKYLEEQLKSYISKKNSEAQITAINIVEACKLDTFQKNLIELVLDASEKMTIREICIYALLHIADEQTKIKLKPLITDQVGEDPDDVLKGCGFQLLWPDYLTAEELFDNLTLPKKQGLTGFYYRFVRYTLCNQFSVKDLPAALTWLEKNMSPKVFFISPAFNELIKTIILKTSENLDEQDLFEAFSRIILSRLDDYGFRNLTAFLRDKWSKDKKQRRDLLLKILPKISDKQEKLRELSIIGLIYNEDFNWLVDQFKTCKEDKDRIKWAYLIQIATWYKEEKEIIMKLGEEYQIIKDVFPYLYKSLEEQSPKEYDKEVFSQKENDNNIKIEDDKEFRKNLLKKIESNLEEIEKGNLENWFYLTSDLSIMPGQNYYLDPLQNTDITKLPAWELINEDIKKDIIKAAEIFILKRQTETDKLLGTNKYIPLDWAGYKALILLLKTSKINIPKDIWVKWASVIMVHPNGNEDLEIRQHLIELCYREAPDNIISSLICLIEKENKEKISCMSLFIDKLKYCWDEPLSIKLLQELNSKNLKADVITPILAKLLEKRIDGARDFAESLILFADSTDEDEFNKAVSVAFLLIMKEEDCGWPIVWPVMNQNENFAKKVLFELARELDLYDKYKDFFLRLGEYELAELLIKIYQIFGYSDNTDFTCMILMSYLREYLKSLGTEESFKALENIIKTIPDKWFGQALLEAKSNFLRKTWKPLMPSDLLNFIKDKSSRIVQNGEQLLDVVIESLERFEKKLRGEKPSVIFLWNKDYRTWYVIEEGKINKLRSEDNIDIRYLKEKVFLKKYIEYKFDSKEIVDKIIEKSNKFNKKESWWPKWENEFSDFIKLYLDNDLEKRKIVVNREVKINRGDKTDIYVQAVEEGEKPFCVIIEVKGCWNKNLDDAMKTQLVEQYIENNENCHHGLYLVAWFYCDQWDNEDSRKDKNPISIEEARNKFNKQAEELSKENLTIKAFVMNTAL